MIFDAMRMLRKLLYYRNLAQRPDEDPVRPCIFKPGGIESKPLPDARRTRRLQGEGQSENLGNALDGEGRIAVPDHIFASIHAADRHAELVWIDARQRRDVVRNPPLADLFASLALAGRQEG